MKTTLLPSIIALCSLGLSLSSIDAQGVIFADNFDGYAHGVLPNGSTWPGATAPHSWTTNTGGPQTIVSGAVAGRSGNLYHYQELAEKQTTTYSSISLGAPSELEQWQVSIDFYLDEITPTTSSFFNILTLGSDAITTTTGQLVRLGVSRRSAAANGDLVFAYEAQNASGGTSTLFQYSSNSTGNRIELDTWYTLTITGNNLDGTFTISVQGGDLDFTSDTLKYRSELSDFSTIAIGDTAANAWTAGRYNSVYLDNFSFRAIPEPSLAVLLPLALATAGAVHLGRQRGNRN